MTNRVRYTYRLNKKLFENLEKEAYNKGISINSVISNILTNYFEFKKYNPNLNGWKFIEEWENKR